MFRHHYLRLPIRHLLRYPKQLHKPIIWRHVEPKAISKGEAGSLSSSSLSQQAHRETFFPLLARLLVDKSHSYA